MKNLFYLLLAATLFACSSEDGTLENNQPQDNPAPAGKYYAVALDLQGEVADFTVTQEPLTKVEGEPTNDLYVINVYSKPAAGGSYTQYAYGTFDRTGGMVVNLLEGNLYQFRVTLVKDAKDKLEWVNDSTYGWYYRSSSSHQAILLNRFVMQTWSESVYGADCRNIYLKDFEASYYRPLLDRYYGEVTDYEPVENGKIAVDLYRVVFGVRVNVAGLEEGQLNFRMTNAPEIVMSADSVYTPDNIYQLWYLDDVVSFVERGEEQTESIGLAVTWTNAAGDRTVNIYSGNFTATRLKRTIFNVTLRQGAMNPGDMEFNIMQEDITDGETIDLEGTINGGEDVEITPGA